MSNDEEDVLTMLSECSYYSENDPDHNKCNCFILPHSCFARLIVKIMVCSVLAAAKDNTKYLCVLLIA